MKGYRALDRGGSASLSAVCHHIKLARAGHLHDAIEDAWLAMQIYPLAARLPASASIASLASSHPIQLASPCDRRIPCRQTGTRPVPTFVKRADRLSIHGIIFVSSAWPRRKRCSERRLQPYHARAFRSAARSDRRCLARHEGLLWLHGGPFQRRLPCRYLELRPIFATSPSAGSVPGNMSRLHQDGTVSPPVGRSSDPWPMASMKLVNHPSSRGNACATSITRATTQIYFVR